MASSPLGLYTRLKTKMKNAYYTDNMVDNLANFRTEASAYLSGPGRYEDLPFLKICENLEGNGSIGWNKLENLKTLVQSASRGKEQLLKMINDAEREIQDNLSGSACCLPPEMSAQKPKLRGEEMVVYMEETVYRVKEGYAAFLDCFVDPTPISVVWKKGEEKRVDKRIPINNKKYYCAGPSSPALVIRLVEKRDEAYYQCTAKDTDTTGNIVIEIQGDAVPLEVDSDEDRSSNTHRTQRSQSLSASGAGGSHSHINIRSSASFQDWQRESPSWPTEDRQQGTKEITIQIWKSSCQMMFTISDYDDFARVASIIKDEFHTATGEKRIEKLDFETKCIRVLVEIKAANSLSEAPAVCLAEQFKHYILDNGLQLSEESNAVLEVDEASIKITPEHMPEDGHPIVNISHKEFSVPNSESVILQTYIISSPPASSIEWFKIKAEDNETLIQIDSKKYYGGSDLSPSLIIRNVNVDDQGWYICRAANNNGTGCSNKTCVRINTEPAGTEDKPGTLVEDISDIRGLVTMTERRRQRQRQRQLLLQQLLLAEQQQRLGPGRRLERLAERRRRLELELGLDTMTGLELELGLDTMTGQSPQRKHSVESTKKDTSDIKESPQRKHSLESTKPDISDIKEQSPQRKHSLESTKTGISDIKEQSPQRKHSLESTKRDTSDIKESPQTKDSPGTTERDISDI